MPFRFLGSSWSRRASATLRPTLRDAVAHLGAASRFTRAGRARADGLTVVTFHRVLPEARRARYPHPGLAVTPGELDFVLDALGRDYTLGSLAELHALADAPKPRLALTFDDGALDNFEHARPVLAAHGARATFFVPAEAALSGVPLWHDRLGFAAMAVAEGRGDEACRARIEALGLELDGSRRASAEALPSALTERAKRLDPAAREALIAELVHRTGAEAPPWAGMMRPSELRALASEGHEIGAHSMTHPLLPQCGDAEVIFEIAESKRRLEAAIGQPVESFCYPNGDWDDRCLRALDRAGYARAVVTLPGVNSVRAERFRLARYDLGPSHLRDRRGALSAPLLAWRLRVRAMAPSQGLS
jgi:peptidoglycan/xylan/chitin deacetylase (PgdA/CDA1 family)